MRLRSGPEHRLPGPPPTHPFSRSTMSNIDPTREHPREAGSSPHVEERAYTLGHWASQIFCYEFSPCRISTIFARPPLPLLRSSEGHALPASHLEGTPDYKVHGRLENLLLTVTEGNGMFQSLNQARLKILHL